MNETDVVAALSDEDIRILHQIDQDRFRFRRIFFQYV